MQIMGWFETLEDGCESLKTIFRRLAFPLFGVSFTLLSIRTAGTDPQALVAGQPRRAEAGGGCDLP